MFQANCLYQLAGINVIRNLIRIQSDYKVHTLVRNETHTRLVSLKTRDGGNVLKLSGTN